MNILRNRSININKLIRYAVITNACQIVAALMVAAYSLLSANFHLSGVVERIVVMVTSMVVIWGAALDIREAFSSRDMMRQRAMLEDAYAQLEELNSTLRAQRHDFMNHIQVIYSLTELEEHASALEYMDRVYADIQKVGRALRTSIPAVNALMAAKMADCEEDGVAFSADIKSPWKDMPVPGWEMCRILGNLIDNAAEAISAQAEKSITVCLWEDLRAYRFFVENSGPRIAADMSDAIFQQGFSTKGTGRGMGLYIVREILREHGGDIFLDPECPRTRFVGEIPKKHPALEG
jgi:two-component system sensor histidine kinase AgrC